MLVLNDPSESRRIGDPAIRSLVEKRYEQICSGEEYQYDKHGYFVVLEPGDTVEELEAETVVPVMSNLYDEAVHFGDQGYCCQFEALEDHGFVYEAVLVMSDDGWGMGIFIPKVDGIPADLLAMCAQFAEPAPASDQR